MSAPVLEGPRGFVPRAELYKALARVDALEAELAELRAQVRLSKKVGASGWIIDLLKATPMEACIIQVLAEADPRRYVPYNLIYDLSEHRRRGDGSSEPYILIKTHICNLRKKLSVAGAPMGALETAHGCGYRLSVNGRAWLENARQRLLQATEGGI